MSELPSGHVLPLAPMTELEARARVPLLPLSTVTVIVCVSPSLSALQMVQKSTMPLSLPHHVEEASQILVLEVASGPPAT